jgi:hypothetical protein
MLHHTSNAIRALRIRRLTGETAAGEMHTMLIPREMERQQDGD